MAGRPRLPAEVKRLRGTLRSYDKEQLEEERRLSVVLPSTKLKVSNKLTDPTVKKAYKIHIELLRSIGVMAEQVADAPLLDNAYFCLEQSIKIREILSTMDVLDDKRTRLEKLYFRFMGTYERIVKDFYLTPKARAQLRLDALSIMEKELHVEEKREDIISRLLRNKES